MRSIESEKVRCRVAVTAASALLALLGANRAHAQVYVSSQSASPFVALSGGTIVPFPDEDESAIAVPIGFSFTYYGHTYTHVNVGTNGVVSFATPCSPTMACPLPFDETCNASNVCERDNITYDPSEGLPNAEDPQNTVAVFWDDLVLELFAAPLSTASYATLGSAPNREFVVEWMNAAHYVGFGSGTASRVTFQIRLSEASGSIKLQYGPYTANAADNSEWTGLIGIENADGTSGIAPPCAVGSSTCDYMTLTSLANQAIEFAVPNAPELVGTVNGPTGADPGAQIQVPVEVRNLGPQPSGAGFAVQVYLSTDETITAQDTLLGTINFQAVGAQATRTQTLNTTLDAGTAPGLYRIGAIIDSGNAITESLETNNTAISATVFLVGADVSVSIDSIADTGPNEQVTFPLRLHNHGSALANVEWAVYLSTDTTYAVGDTLLASGSRALPALPETVVDVTATIPDNLVPGNYFLVAVADPANLITEADETNNTGASAEAAEIVGPDVVSASVDGEDFVFRGEAYTITFVVRNDGLATATDFHYSFHLSDNQLVTFTDPLLGEFGPISLAPGESQTIVQTVTVSSTITAGEYYLGAISDSRTVILEALEANNVHFRREMVTVRDPAADFSAAEVILPANAAAGESFTLERVVANVGNAPGSVEYVAYLSLDDTLDTTVDFELARATKTLGSHEDDRGVDNVRIPAQAPGGNYFVLYQVDPANMVDELYEDNNLAVSQNTVAVIPAQLTVLTRDLPIATLNLPFAFVLAAAGGAGSYTWALASGALPTGLSVDAMGRISGTPTEEGMFSFVVTVSDGSLTIPHMFQMLVGDQSAPLEVATRVLIPAFVGRGYSYPLTAFGGLPPYTWSTPDELPAGFSLSPEGVISGTPSGPALDTLNFSVTDAAGHTAERPLDIRVVSDDASVRFSTDVLPDGTLGESYSEEVTVEPGTGESPFVYELASGELPTGLQLVDNRVMGTPERVGTFTVTIRVSDNRGDYDLNIFRITINEAAGVAISTTSLPAATVGQEYKEEGNPVRLKAFSSGRSNATVSFAIVSGELPPGLTLATDGTIQGTPTQSGAYVFLIVANDDAAQSDHRALGIAVSDVVEEPKVTDDGGCGCSTETSGDARSAVWTLVVLGAAFFFRRRSTRRKGWRNVRGMIAVLALIAPAFAQAQTGPYFISSRNETYVSRTNGTPIGWSSNDDDETVVTLPFPFKFYNDNYSTVVVGTNGLISFDASTTYLPAGNDTIPDSFEPNAVVAAFWDDLVVGAGTTHVEGTAPTRVFIIQYENVTRYNQSSGSISFQIRLYEGPGGKIEIAYGSPSGISATSWDATTGVEDVTGSAGFYFLSCNAACTGAALTSAVDTVQVAQQDAGLDVIPGTISAPTVAYSGVPFTIDITMLSLHQDPIGPFRYAIHLVESGSTVADNPIYVSDPITLAAYQTLDVQMSTSVPLNTPEGRYRLALEVDYGDAVNEPDESNVVFSDVEFRVGPPQPDFLIASLSTPSTQVAPGGTLPVTVELENGGNLAGDAHWAVFLSRNNVVSTDDLEIAAGDVSLALLTTSSVTLQVTLPSSLAPGDYYLGAVIDAENAVAELNEVNNDRVSATALNIAVDALDVASTSLPGGYVGVAYDTYLQANGGDGSYSWSITQGELPAGLTLIATTGEIRGEPSSEGTANFTVQVSSAGRMASADVSIAIAIPSAGLVIATRELLPGVVGDGYPPSAGGTTQEEQQHLIAIGGTGPITFESEGDLPPGLVLDADGYLHGTPEQRGVFELHVRASDGAATAARTILLTVAEPGRLALIAAVLPDGVIGEEYTYQLRTIGHTNTATLGFVSDDTLPPGIAVTADGRITGVPEQAGSWQFGVTVTEGSGPNAARDSATFVLAVSAESGFRITPSAVPDAEVGAMYSATINVIGGQPPFSWHVEGELPAGLMQTVTTEDMRESLTIQGTPTQESFSAVLVRVDDAVGRHAMMPLSIRVAKAPVAPTNTDDGGCGCTTGARSESDPASFLMVLVALFFGRKIIGQRSTRSR